MPILPIPTSEADRALEALTEGYRQDRSVAVGIFTDPSTGVVTHEALAVLVDEGLARYSTEGQYALLTPEALSYLAANGVPL